jgi:hypothetical protein
MVWRTGGAGYRDRGVVMRKLIVPLIIIAPLLSVLAAGAGQGVVRASPQDGGPQATGGEGGAVKVTITTGGGLFGPAKDRYRVGQRVPVVISMTNQGSEPVYICDTGTLYQDRPSLSMDGRPVPYMDLQKVMMNASEKDKTCERLDEDLDLQEQRLLKPGETSVVDWFILAEGKTLMGDLAWYEQLRPGKYELTTRRLLGCCKGSFVESNKISFEVEP